MDMNALAADWLGAVLRVRSASYQSFVQQVPQTRTARADRTLTDVIESALRNAGATAVQPVSGVTDIAAIRPTTAQRVDLIA